MPQCLRTAAMLMAPFSTPDCLMHLYVSDSDQTYECALQHGATSLMAPMMRPHGDRMAGFCDPFGNIWWVAERRGEKRSS